MLKIQIVNSYITRQCNKQAKITQGTRVLTRWKQAATVIFTIYFLQIATNTYVPSGQIKFQCFFSHSTFNLFSRCKNLEDFRRCQIFKSERIGSNFLNARFTFHNSENHCHKVICVNNYRCRLFLIFLLRLKNLFERAYN